MDKNILIRTSKIKLCVVIISLFSLNNLLHAQKYSTITGLAFNGKSADTVKINILPPGRGGNITKVSIGYQLISGTKMIIPPYTIVKLRSPGGQQEVIPTNPGKSIEYKVELNAQSENHVVKGLGAQIVNTVNKKLGYKYRNGNERGTTAAAKSTIFTFTDFSESKNEKATVMTTEGSINITDEVPVNINGVPVSNNRHGGQTTKSLSITQSAGDNDFTSSDEAIEYQNYDEAVNTLIEEINGEENDPEDLADDLMCLGDLYMNMRQPEKAIKPFSDAANYYENEYGNEDLATMEANISLAEAYMGANNSADGSAILLECISILEDQLTLMEEDFDFVKENDNTESLELICYEINEICVLLGKAYEIQGGTSKSNAYYKKADSDCKY